MCQSSLPLPLLKEQCDIDPCSFTGFRKRNNPVFPNKLFLLLIPPLGGKSESDCSRHTLGRDGRRRDGWTNTADEMGFCVVFPPSSIVCRIRNEKRFFLQIFFPAIRRCFPIRAWLQKKRDNLKCKHYISLPSSSQWHLGRIFFSLWCSGGLGVIHSSLLGGRGKG